MSYASDNTSLPPILTDGSWAVAFAFYGADTSHPLDQTGTTWSLVFAPLGRSQPAASDVHELTTATGGGITVSGNVVTVSNAAWEGWAPGRYQVELRQTNLADPVPIYVGAVIVGQGLSEVAQLGGGAALPAGQAAGVQLFVSATTIQLIRGDAPESAAQAAASATAAQASATAAATSATGASGSATAAAGSATAAAASATSASTAATAANASATAAGTSETNAAADADAAHADRLAADADAAQTAADRTQTGLDRQATDADATATAADRVQTDADVTSAAASAATATTQAGIATTQAGNAATSASQAAATLAGAVRFDEPQSLTTPQQAQARANIAAVNIAGDTMTGSLLASGSAADLGDATHQWRDAYLVNSVKIGAAASLAVTSVVGITNSLSVGAPGKYVLISAAQIAFSTDGSSRNVAWLQPGVFLNLTSAMGYTVSSSATNAGISPDVGLFRKAAAAWAAGNGAPGDDSAQLWLTGVRKKPSLVSQLPTPTSAIAGLEMVVSDANGPAYGAVLIGGGTDVRGARCTGSDWRAC